MVEQRYDYPNIMEKLEEQAGRLIRIEGHQERFCRDLKTIERKLFGNGQEGEIESIWKQIRRLNYWKAWIIGGIAFLGVAATLLAIIITEYGLPWAPKLVK